MNDLEPGTMVIMVKNDDGTFSPVGMSKSQAYILNTFLSGLSKDEPLIIKENEKYEKRRDYKTLIDQNTITNY